MTTLSAWPLDNTEYTAVHLGAAYAARSRGLLHSTDFAALTNGDNTVSISPGIACLHVSDFWAIFPVMPRQTVLEFPAADGEFPRIDAVALFYDKNNNAVALDVRSGMPSASPERPVLRRDDDYDELLLYEVLRPAGAVKITADQITDLRLDGSVCGLMRDAIDSIDTSVMQAQFTELLGKIDGELSRLNAGTEAMLKTVYDPKGKNKDVFEEIANATSNSYTITVPASGWADGALTFQGISCTKYNTVAVAGVTADTRLSLGRYVSGDLESCRSYICQDTGSGTVTFWATDALAEFTVELVEVK